VDAQSVTNTDTAQGRGYDAGKKVSGLKRHIAVDTQGRPHAITVTSADANIRNAAFLMFLLNAEGLSEVRNVLVDGAYSGARLEDMTAQILGAAVEVVKRNERHKFAVIPRR
jgi:transposase